VAILNRVTTLIRANVNDLLDRAEDPEKTLNQILRDMAAGISEARSQVADVIAQQKLTEASLHQAKTVSEEWGRKAAVALRSGSEDLARECLRRRNDYQQNADLYERQLASQTETTNQLRKDLQLLAAKYAKTERDKEALLARYHVTKAQEKIQKVQVTGTFDDPANDLRRMEDKIMRGEARVAGRAVVAGDSLESRLSQLDAAEGDLSLEADLLELKARLAPPPAAEAPTEPDSAG